MTEWIHLCCNGTALMVLALSLAAGHSLAQEARVNDKTGQNAKSKEPEIAEEKEFSCSPLPGITFKYPIFKGWAVKDIETGHPQQCTIWLNWPDNIDFEVPPKIVILKLKEPILLARKLAVNPYGVHFLSEVQPAAWQPACDFYVNDFTVRITATNYGGPYFWKMIIDTFRTKD